MMLYAGTIVSVQGADEDGLGVPSSITYTVSYTVQPGDVREISGATPPREHIAALGDDFGIRAITPGTLIIMIRDGDTSRWFPTVPEMLDIHACEDNP